MILVPTFLEISVVYIANKPGNFEGGEDGYCSKIEGGYCSKTGICKSTFIFS
jgi:hypothetical protein